MTMRLAVLGSGFIADMHIRAAASLPDAHVVGVAAHHAERVRSFAAERGIETATTDWATLVTEPDVDAVVIGTPNSLHAEQALLALANGKHVLVEKPMAITTADAAAMIAAAADAERVLAVGHMWRYHHDVVALNDRVRSGRLGRIVRTHGWGVHAHWGPSGWFTDPQLAGGGALIDMGIHAIDTVRFLLDDPMPLRVAASIGVGDYGAHDGQPVEVDDDGLVLIDWEGGTRSMIEFGWWAPQLNGLEADTEVFGTKGHDRVWEMSLPPAAGYVHCDVPMYAAQLADFMTACESGGTPLASAEVGYVALDIVERAYLAAR